MKKKRGQALRARPVLSRVEVDDDPIRNRFRN